MLRQRTTVLVLLVLPAFLARPGRLMAEGESIGASAEAGLIATAKRIHQRILTLDTHVDIPGAQYATEKLDPGVDHPKLKCDLVKMVRGGVDGVFLAVYVGQGKRETEGYRRAFEDAMAKFDAIHRLVREMHPDRCELATSPDDVVRIAKTGKRAIMIGVENGYPIGTDLANVDRFYDLGARYITLSHGGHNQICDSANPVSRLGDGQSEHNGLSGFGEQVVARMNRLGMMVDVSHISAESFWDVIEVTRAPIIASHSGCRALNDNPRNLDDAQLKALSKNRGVIQIVALGSYLRTPSPKRGQAVRELAKKTGVPMRRGRPRFWEATGQKREQFWEGMKEIDQRYPAANVSDYVNHIEHAVRVAGIDHVGIGTDFDGGGGVPGFNDHSESLNVTVELLRRGYSEEDIEKIWGGNLLRVWRDAERVAAELQKGKQD